MGHDRLVVLDDDDRHPRVDEPVEQAQEVLDVGEVQTRRRLIEHVDAALLAHVHRELQPLPLPAREGGQRLADPDVAEPDIHHPVQDRGRRRHLRLARAEELRSVGCRHIEHLDDVLAAQQMDENRLIEALALTHVARGLHLLHGSELGHDDARPLAHGARAVGVRTEQRGLDAVRLRERLADRLEHPRVGTGARAARALDRALIDRDDTLAAGNRSVDQRALARSRDPGDGDQDAERDVDIHVLQVVGARAAHFDRPRRLADGCLQLRPIVQVPPREGSRGPQRLDRALEHDLPAARSRAGPEVDDMVGDRDRFGLVLDDEHRVALVAQLLEEAVHALDVVRVQPHRRLVEDIGDVGESRPEVPDHLGALRLAARERPRCAIEREVAEADVDERVEEDAEAPQQGSGTRFIQPFHPGGKIRDLHGAGIRDALACDLRRSRPLVEAGSAALGAGLERNSPFDECADVGLHRVDVLRQERLLDLRHQTLVGHVDVLELDLARLAVEEVVPLLLGEVLDRHIHRHDSAEDLHVPAIGRVSGNRERPGGERLRLVEQLREIDVADLPHAVTVRAHSAGDGEAAPFDLLAVGGMAGHSALAADRGDVERERLRAADVRLADAAEEDPQEGVGIRRRSHGRPGVGAHPLLVDDDRGREALEHVDIRTRGRVHERLDERRIRLVDHPRRLGGDRPEHERAFA